MQMIASFKELYDASLRMTLLNGEYRLNTLTYGQASASFLAIRCVRQLADEKAAQFVLASQVLLNNLMMYVDDIITRVDSEINAIELTLQLEILLKAVLSPTRRSNCGEVLRSLSTTGRQVDEPSVLAIDSAFHQDTGFELVSHVGHVSVFCRLYGKFSFN